MRHSHGRADQRLLRKAPREPGAILAEAEAVRVEEPQVSKTVNDDGWDRWIDGY